MAMKMIKDVGLGCDNLPTDVAIIQDLFNRAEPDAGRLVVDGLTSGPFNERIKTFQTTTLKSARPDGQISPHGPTVRALEKMARAAPMNPKLVLGSRNWGRWKKLDVSRFCDLYSLQYDETWPGLTVLATAIRDDPDVTDIRWAAYMLATAWKECYDWTIPKRFAPIAEVGKGRTHRVRDAPPAQKEKLKISASTIGDFDQGDDYGYGDTITFVDAAGKEHADNIYYGRGYVQLTWLGNYLRAGRRLGRAEELAIDPDQVLDQGTAYTIMTRGMREGGWFTKYALKDFIHDDACDYFDARQIINGHNEAKEIGEVAKILEFLLRIVSA